MTGLNASFLSPAAVDALGFKALGKNVVVHSTAVLVDCGKICLGSNVRIDPYVIISGTGGVVIGSNVHIAAHCSLTGEAEITLGDFSGLSQGVRIFSSSDDYSGHSLTNPTVPASFKRIQSASIQIGRHAIIGSSSVILPGADVTEGVAVGALSMVHNRLEPWSVYSGVPARRLGNRSRDLLALESSYLASLS